MCTLSWVLNATGYELLMNRDERRTRLAAAGPAVRWRRGARFLAPADGELGGTWAAVNERGLAVCLLNGPSAPLPVRPRASRGWLPIELIDASRAGEAIGRLEAGELRLFAPFVIAVFEPGAQPAVAAWDGARLTVDREGQAYMPLTSSSFDREAVIAARRAEFRRLTARGASWTAASMARFHTSHQPEPGPYSICMHRPDAETVSLTRIEVTFGSVALGYRPGPPCRPGARTEWVTLPRRLPPAAGHAQRLAL